MLSLRNSLKDRAPSDLDGEGQIDLLQWSGLSGRAEADKKSPPDADAVAMALAALESEAPVTVTKRKRRSAAPLLFIAVAAISAFAVRWSSRNFVSLTRSRFSD